MLGDVFIFIITDKNEYILLYFLFIAVTILLSGQTYYWFAGRIFYIVKN